MFSMSELSDYAINNDSKVSVVVPLYNNQKYIESCIGSISAQTYRNIEIIVIDDGSTDESLTIAKHYETLDNRIRVVHQENSGVGRARNTGIDISTGKYVMFVDSDDTIADNMIEILLKYSSKNILAFSQTNHSPIYNGKTDNFLSDYIHTRRGIPYGCLGKLYDSKIIKDNDIRFEENLHCDEDLFFNLEYFKYITGGVCAKETKYYVTVHRDSLTHTRIPDNTKVYRRAYETIENSIFVDMDYDNTYSFLLLTINDFINQLKIAQHNGESISRIICRIKEFASDNAVRSITKKYFMKLVFDKSNLRHESMYLCTLRANKYIFISYVLLIRLMAFWKEKFSERYRHE